MTSTSLIMDFSFFVVGLVWAILVVEAIVVAPVKWATAHLADNVVDTNDKTED